jgi:hypothetical protein
MKRICFLIPDGIGIRNYLYSEVISILIEQGYQVILWHSLDPELIQLTEKRLGVSFEQYPFEHKPDGMRVQLLREAARYARLKLNARLKNNPTILTNWTVKTSSKKGYWLIKGAEILGSFLNSYSAVASVESLEFKLISSSKSFQLAENFLKEIKPDLIFCTHQRVFSVTSAIEAAKSLGIKTSTAIFSWDNLPKGRLPFRTDQYLVWSNYMLEELRVYYPEINENQIKVTGSPQFDFYFQNGILLDREVFAKKYNLDSSKTWVCFSGSDSLTSPNDPLFLRDVAGSHWGNFFPLFEDVQLLVNLAFHCKVVVNMGSTMALDFSTFGNIGLYLRYDHANVSTESSVKTIFEFQHFRSMGDWKAVGYINSPSQIAPMVNKAIDKPNKVAPDRMLWFNKIVEPKTDKTASLQIVEALDSL